MTWLKINQNKDKTITPKYIDYSDDERSNTCTSIEVDERIHILNFTDIIALSVNNGITTIDTTKQSYETTETLNHYEKNYLPLYLLKYIALLSLIKNISKQ